MSDKYPSATFLNAFSDYDKWAEICKQSIFEAWVPYVTDRPIDFFISKEGSSNEGYVTNVIDDKTPLSEHKVINHMKRRKVVVLTSDELCCDHKHPDVLVAKIVSVKEKHKTQEFYKTYLLKDKHPLYVHLSKDITGEESYINLGQLMTIGKKMLIEKRGFLPEDRMLLVEDRIEEYLDLGNVKTNYEVASNE